MLMLVALALAQTCSMSDDLVCPGSVVAPRGRFYVVEPYGSGSGNALQSHRAYNDEGADLTLMSKDGVTRDLDTIHIELRRDGQGVFRLLNSGEVQAGGHQDSAASFTDLSSADGHAFGRCIPGSGEMGGCYIILRANMSPANAGAFHGLLTVGNERARDGGVWLQGQGVGKTSAKSSVFHGTVTAFDDFGNAILRDGWVYQTLHTADRGACYTSTVWDGEWHQPGGYGYDVDEDALVFRSASQCAIDGGVEHIITTNSLEARLASVEARLAALEAYCH